MTRTSAEVISDARSTREAEEALALRRAELGEVGYVQAMRRLVGPERYVDWIEGMYLGRYGRGSSRCGGAEKGQQMAAAKKQAFEFRGRLVTVDSKAPKEKSDWQGTRLEGGALVITVEVPRPKLPEAPKKNYPLTLKRPADPGPEPVFTTPAQDAGESAADFKKRTKEASAAHAEQLQAWQRARGKVDEWEAALVKHNSLVEKHRQASERVAGEFAAYAQMAGVGALIQGLPVRLALTPDASAMRTYLPGFSPAGLLSAPAAAAFEDEPEQDEDGDEPDDDDADGSWDEDEEGDEE